MLFSKIQEIESLRHQLTRLIRQETEASAPILADLSLLPRLYYWFGEALQERGCSPCIESVSQRKKFLYIILYLYSPASLAGGKMTLGLRDKLAELFQLRSRTTISDNCGDVVFLYCRYKDFHEEVDDIFLYIMEQLKVNKFITNNQQIN